MDAKAGCRGLLCAALLVAAPGCRGAADAQDTWTVSEARRIGPPAAEFGAVTDVALDGAGRLWVVDGMSGELHVAGADGLRRIAGPGQGPGELRPGPIEILMLPGDTALVIEPHTRRFHRFGPDGSYASTATITRETGRTGGWRMLPGGRLAARIYPSSSAGTNDPGGDPVRAFDLVGRAGDVLAVLPPTESFRAGDGPLPVITLLAPQPVWTVDEVGRVLEASTHEYEVRAHAGGDSALIVLTGPASGAGVDGGMAAKARELLLETLLTSRTPPQVAERMALDARISEEAPVVGDVMAGPRGTIWVQQPVSAAGELLDLQRPGGPSWHVHDARGRRMGTATLPPGVQPLEWSGDRLVGIARDQLGQSSAIVLRVEAPDR